MSNPSSVDEAVRHFAVAMSNMITAITAAETSRRVAEYRKMLTDITARTSAVGGDGPDQPLLVDGHQAAKMLGVSKGTLSNYSVQRGPIPMVKIGARTCYHVKDLEMAIEQMKRRN